MTPSSPFRLYPKKHPLWRWHLSLILLLIYKSQFTKNILFSTKKGLTVSNLNGNIKTLSNSCTFLLSSPRSALSAIQLQRNELKLSQQRRLFCTRRLEGEQTLAALSEHGRQIKLGSPPLKSGPGRPLWLNSRWSIPTAAANWSQMCPCHIFPALHRHIIPHFPTWVMQKLSLPFPGFFVWLSYHSAGMGHAKALQFSLSWKLQT